MSRDTLVSTRALLDGLRELEVLLSDGARFLPDFVAKRDERLLLEFRRLLREAEVEYVSSGAASDLTGWDASTLRKYGRAALAGDALPEEWSRLVVRRDGKEFAFVLASIPAKGARAA